MAENNDAGSSSNAYGSESHYDGSASLYVLMSFLLMILIPWTLKLVYNYFYGQEDLESAAAAAVEKASERRHREEEEDAARLALSDEAAASVPSAKSRLCRCDKCKEKAKHVKKTSRKSSSAICYWTTFVLMWLTVFTCIALVSQQEPEQHERFNPFDVLQLSESASAKEIKAAVKTLSKKWHPDKNKDNVEYATQMFQKIQMAKQTLTDDTKYENWVKYGNPDGPQAYAVGIALPSWLVADDNSTIVLLGYLLVFVIILPTIVVCVWWRWKEVAPNQLLYYTMQVFFNFLTADMRHKKMIDVLSAAVEFKQIPQRGTDEEDLKQLDKAFKLQSPEVRPVPMSKNSVFRKELLVFPAVPKIAMLYHAHLCRLHDQLTPPLRADLNQLMEKVHHLINGMVMMLSEAHQGRRNQQQPGQPASVIAVLEACRLSQMMTQACWKHQELLQLPHMTEEWLKEMNKKRWGIREGKIQSFLAMPEASRRELLLGPEGLRNNKNYTFLSDAQYRDVEAVCSMFPANIRVGFKCKVEDTESFISPNSVVSLFARCDRVLPGDASLQTDWLDDGDDDDGDDDMAIHSRSKKSAAATTTSANNSNSSTAAADGPAVADIDTGAQADDESDDSDVDEDAEEEKWHRRQLKTKTVDRVDVRVHCPWFPGSKSECWWLILTDESKKNVWGIKKLVINPVGHENELLKINFLAPKEVGKYTWYLHLVSDSYLGFDKCVPLSFEVKPSLLPPPELERFSSEEDDEDEDELHNKDELDAANNTQEIKDLGARKKKMLAAAAANDSDSDNEID